MLATDRVQRFKSLRPDGRCGECGSKVYRQTRLNPTSANCRRCGYAYELDGTPNGYSGSLMTKAEYEYEQARRATLEAHTMARQIQADADEILR